MASIQHGTAAGIHHNRGILLLAVVAAATVSVSSAWPLQEREPGSGRETIDSINLQLKYSINALYFVTRTRLVSQQMDACALWNKVVATTTHILNSNTTTEYTASEHIRNTTCKKISQGTDLGIIQEDGSCSEDVLEYLCSRNSQMMVSYDLFGRINVDLEPNSYNQWVTDTFASRLDTDQLQQLFN